MEELIINYRRDADTQNFIDTLQADVSYWQSSYAASSDLHCVFVL